MKKLLLISAIAFVLFSCKKSSVNANINTNTSWTSGKWKRSYYGDTVYTSSKVVAGINSFPVDLNPNELNFNTPTTGTSSKVNAGSFNYSASSLTYNNGQIWQIVQLSPTKLKLTLYSSVYYIGYNDTYTKE
jgi:hypothetical protein